MEAGRRLPELKPKLKRIQQRTCFNSLFAQVRNLLIQGEKNLKNGLLKLCFLSRSRALKTSNSLLVLRSAEYFADAMKVSEAIQSHRIYLAQNLFGFPFRQPQIANFLHHISWFSRRDRHKGLPQNACGFAGGSCCQRVTDAISPDHLKGSAFTLTPF